MAEDKKEEAKTELTKQDLQMLVNVLVATPTQNLQTAQQLINLSNKISLIIDKK